MYDCGFQNVFQNGIKIDCRALEKSTRNEATVGQNLTTFINRMEGFLLIKSLIHAKKHF